MFNISFVIVLNIFEISLILCECQIEVASKTLSINDNASIIINGNRSIRYVCCSRVNEEVGTKKNCTWYIQTINQVRGDYFRVVEAFAAFQIN